MDNKDECISGSNLASTDESAFDISGRDTSDSMPWNAIAEWAEGEDRTCAERPCRGIEGYVQLGRLLLPQCPELFGVKPQPTRRLRGRT